MASLISGKFSVVTTLSRSIPAIEHNLTRYGLASRCARVRASEVPVLDGVAAAVKLAEGLASLGLKTSKRGGYGRPRAKAYHGIMAPFSPACRLA